jgi:hypothetical protein
MPGSLLPQHATPAAHILLLTVTVADTECLLSADSVPSVLYALNHFHNKPVCYKLWLHSSYKQGN